MNNIAIGNKISETRKKRGYSIREFSKRVDLSAALLSQIERGLANPSLNTLRMIADGLNIPLYTLFIDEIKHELLILRKEDRQTIDRNPENVVFDLLSPDYMKSNVEILWAVLNPRTETAEGHLLHEKEEFAIVMKGTVWVIIDAEAYELYEGDTVRLLPRMKHKFRNDTDEPVEVLYILAPSSL